LGILLPLSVKILSCDIQVSLNNIHKNKNIIRYLSRNKFVFYFFVLLQKSLFVFVIAINQILIII